jgi:benzaldehyde dehydrogenase (NAD)
VDLSKVFGQVQTDNVTATALQQAQGVLDNYSQMRGLDAVHGQAAAQQQISSIFDKAEGSLSSLDQVQQFQQTGIISRSVGRAMALGEKLRVGLLHINDQTVADEVLNPFGGRGKSGNGTSIGGPANWDEFSQWQWVTIQDTAPAYPF